VHCVHAPVVRGSSLGRSTVLVRIENLDFASERRGYDIRSVRVAVVCLLYRTWYPPVGNLKTFSVHKMFTSNVIEDGRERWTVFFPLTVIIIFLPRYALKCHVVCHAVTRFYGKLLILIAAFTYVCDVLFDKLINYVIRWKQTLHLGEW
jgi:hypothetical protein